VLQIFVPSSPRRGTLVPPLLQAHAQRRLHAATLQGSTDPYRLVLVNEQPRIHVAPCPQWKRQHWRFLHPQDCQQTELVRLVNSGQDNCSHQHLIRRLLRAAEQVNIIQLVSLSEVDTIRGHSRLSCCGKHGEVGCAQGTHRLGRKHHVVEQHGRAPQNTSSRPELSRRSKF